MSTILLCLVFLVLPDSHAAGRNVALGIEDEAVASPRLVWGNDAQRPHDVATETIG